ncbi:nitrogen fixation protein NifZ [Uliginosibacterium paludis]|uniref:Nitrogen fixation protein NifZ n=1 Tax=Uliginosibacterium paludis TaxID=1615952 RepID=A0ABV2CLK2_9RHOO
MGDISRDSDTVELTAPPEFSYGERVVTRYTIRNDGTYCGKDIGEVLAHKGDIGFVTSIGNFLQQYYIYAVEFLDTGNRVGMRGRELVSLDKLPPHVIEALGPEKLERLREIRPGDQSDAVAQPLSVQSEKEPDHVRVA